MSNITIEALSSLIYDYISAQAKRDAERDARDAEREVERKKRDAEMDAERKKRDAEIDKRHEQQQAERKADKEKYERQQAESKAKYEQKQADYERQQAESKAKYDQQQADYEKRWKRLQQELGRLGGSYGEQIEAMFVNLGTKFNELGYSFPKEAKETKFIGKDRQVLAEVDRLLENGSVIMPVEVKAKLKKDDVDDHIRRLGIISKYNIIHNDNRKVIGAVAGGIVPQNVLEYAQKQGLYVLVQNGESIEIVKTPPDFKPKEW